MPPKLGLLAGGGALPDMIVRACQRQNRPVHVIAFEGHTEPDFLRDVPHHWLRLGAVGALIRTLKAERVGEVMLAGGLERPSWKALRPDFRGMALMTRMMASGQGDDSVLAIAMAELEREGFRVIGAHQLMPELLASAGAMTRQRPDRQAMKDIEKGVAVARLLGGADIGQAVIVQQGLVLGVEAIEGTDRLIRRCADLHRTGEGGVLVKCRKPQQDPRADLPTIGLATVACAAESGLRGLAVEADATLLIDRDAMVDAAERAGLFIYGFSGEPD